MKINSEHSTTNASLKHAIEKLHASILALCPNKNLPTIENIGRAAVVVPPIVAPPARPMSVPTAAALKMGVGFPLTNLPGSSDDTNRILSTQCQNNSKLMHECGICKRCTDQHLLAKCDTCHLHYHLGCLNPPLTRHPKKSKLYGWQCSECAKSDDSDNPVPILPVGPRKSRTKYSKDGQIVPVDPPQSDISMDEPKSMEIVTKTIKSPPRKTVEKKTEIIDKIEEVLVQSIEPKSAGKGVKRKKLKNSNADVQPDTIGLDERPAIPLPKPSLTADPLDISNAQLIVISSPNKRAKVVDKVEESPKTAAPSYYVDHNGMLASIDSLPKTGLFTSELVQQQHQQRQHSENNDKSVHKQNRKKRNKEKHRNKYGPDSDRSSSKEHKKKRKKKSHDDMENPNTRPDNSEGIPKIKIKVHNMI